MASLNETTVPDHHSSTLNSTSSWQTEAVRGVQITATLLIFLVGVPLNGVVVWALGRPYRRYLVRRGSSGEGTGAASSFHVYVMHLALADLVLLLRTPLMLGYLAHDYSWPFGQTFCRLVVFLRVLGLYSTAFLLCTVAVERCLCLLKPVWVRLRRPSWAVSLACGLIWLLAAIMSVPYFFSADLKEGQQKYQCRESGEYNTGLFVTETIAGFILPILVFLGSNLVVLVTVRQAVPSTSSSNSRRITRIYQVLFFTMLLFVTCWVPYFVCRFLLALARGGPDHAFYRWASKGAYVSLYLVYVKSALNPALYVFAARGLGRAVRASLASMIEQLFNEDSVEPARRTLSRGSLRENRTFLSPSAVRREGTNVGLL